MVTDSAAQALSILRDGSQFQWYIIPLLALVLYVYSAEIQKKRWNIVFAGLAFWGMDWINEIWNSLVFHFTGYAPMWGAPGDTAFLILIGLNIEIMFMFSIAGIVFTKTLPDKDVRILGMPNRIVLAVGWAAFCVIVEIWLNSVNALTWDWRYWNASSPIPIFLFGYLHFFVVAFLVHDMKTLKAKIITVGTIFGIAILALAVFLPLGWI